MHNSIKQNSYSRYADNRDVISLFSGAMGLDIGLDKAGLNVVICMTDALLANLVFEDHEAGA